VNIPNHGRRPVAANNNSELNGGVMILFTRTNGDGDDENSDCIERTTVGFF